MVAVLGPSIARMEEEHPIPERVRAAAVLRAYSEKNVPLPVQEAASWYGLGGRYWVLVWMVCGWKTEGDKMLASDSLRWGMPLSADEAAHFWRELVELADISDEWQVADGRDVSPPPVDVGAMLSAKIDWKQFVRLSPIWDRLPKKPRPEVLIAFLRDAYRQLQEWRKKRQVPAPLRPPLPTVPTLPKVGAGGALLFLAVLLILGGSRSSRRRRRR